MKQALRLLLLIILVAALLLHGGTQTGNPDSSGDSLQTPGTSGPDTTQTQPTQTVPVQTQPSHPLPTEPQTTQPPTQSSPPVDTQPSGEYIGNLYTRPFLESLDSTPQGYGQGPNVDSKNRPTGAIYIHQKYNKYDAHFIGPDDGNVYLTFSLGYEYENLTASILDTLKEKDVKAIFFINQHYAEANQALVWRMINEGHIVGSHATGHYDMGRISIDKMVSEIMTIHNYVLSTYGYEMTYFRPPSGYFNEQLLAVAQSLGYTTVNWSYAYADWDPETPADPEKTLVKLVNALHSGSIYQLHTVSSTNAAILPDFIDAALSKGYTFALLEKN